MYIQEFHCRDFPGGPVVKTSPSSAGGVGSIPDRGAKIPHAPRPKNQNRKQKQYCNKFNKDFKNGPHQKKNLEKKKKRNSAVAQGQCSKRFGLQILFTHHVQEHDEGLVNSCCLREDVEASSPRPWGWCATQSPASSQKGHTV